MDGIIWLEEPFRHRVNNFEMEFDRNWDEVGQHVRVKDACNASATASPSGVLKEQPLSYRRVEMSFSAPRIRNEDGPLEHRG